MAKLKVDSMPTRKKVVPLVMAIANQMIKKLRIVEIINEAVKWDRSHWNISPGGLAKMLIMSTFTDIRIPLTHLEDRLENIDAEFFLDPEDKSTFVNESNVGEALDRIGEADYDGMYEKIALSAVHQYDIPITRMHGDTTTISFSGEYDMEEMDLSEEEKEDILQIERGYNKDGRHQDKQVVVGQIVNEFGLPIAGKTMDGATSDVDWNREAIDYVEKIAEAGFTEGIFVADCKLVDNEHVTRMNDPDNRIQFVSRCPANFNHSLQHRMITQAYESDQWETIGAVTDAKNATQYKGISFTEEVCGAPMRLLVLESDTLQQKAMMTIAQKESKLKPIIKALEKKQWMCQTDAEAERKTFLSMKELALFDCDVNIEKCIKEKWPKGRRGNNTKPILEETFYLRVENITRSESACQEFLQKESCIVLISNVSDDVCDKDLLKIYKGQQTVENSFRALKSPQLASVIYLKNQTRIQVLTMLLTLSLLLRALIQFRLREGLKAHNEANPNVPIRAGWGGRPLKNPTFKLLYEHSINCCFEREHFCQYIFGWPSSITRQRVEPLLELMGLTLEQLVQ